MERTEKYLPYLFLFLTIVSSGVVLVSIFYILATANQTQERLTVAEKTLSELINFINNNAVPADQVIK